MSYTRLIAAAILALACAEAASEGAATDSSTETAAAQQGAATQDLQVQPSGRATAAVAFQRRGAQGTAGSIRIDYGQPHARGREVAGGLIPYGQVWRAGANAATSLVTDVDLTIGNLNVPRGSYTLFVEASQGGGRLIVNKQTGQWGTAHDAAQDLGRADMTARTLSQPIESFTIWLIPSGDGQPRGELRMAWGNVEYTIPWSVR